MAPRAVNRSDVLPKAKQGNVGSPLGANPVLEQPTAKDSVPKKSSDASNTANDRERNNSTAQPSSSDDINGQEPELPTVAPFKVAESSSDLPERIEKSRRPKDGRQNEVPNGNGQEVVQSSDRSLSGTEDGARRSSAEDNNSVAFGSSLDDSRSDNAGRRPQSPWMHPSNAFVNSHEFCSRVAKDCKIGKRRPSLAVPRQVAFQTQSLPEVVDQVPSEEDLYFLLLHRLRQREGADKSSKARLHQLEHENAMLHDKVQGCAQRVDSLHAAADGKDAEICRQKAVINDTKRKCASIKEFMKKIRDDRDVLRTKFDLMSQQHQELQNDRHSFSQCLEAAQNSAQSSSGVIARFNGRVGDIRHETSHLSSLLRETKNRLTGEQQLLIQEKQKNAVLEAQIHSMSHKQESSIGSILQEQQHFCEIMKTLRDKVCQVQRGQDSVELIQGPALRHCQDMLMALCQVEVVTSADMKDVIQVVGGLRQRYVMFLRSPDALTKDFVSTDSSNGHAMILCDKIDAMVTETSTTSLAQIADQLKVLTETSRQEDVIRQLWKMRETLEGHIQVANGVSLETQSSKEAADRRAEDLQSEIGKLSNDIGAIREATIAPKRGPGHVPELQSLLIKWTSANNLLAEALQKVEAKDEKIQDQDKAMKVLSLEAKETRSALEELTQRTRELTQVLCQGDDFVSREGTHPVGVDVGPS